MSLLFSFFISSVGLAYFVYGKKTTEFSFLIFGMVLMIYPYFVRNMVLLIVLGLVLSVLPFITKRIL